MGGFTITRFFFLGGGGGGNRFTTFFVFCGAIAAGGLPTGFGLGAADLNRLGRLCFFAVSFGETGFNLSNKIEKHCTTHVYT